MQIRVFYDECHPAPGARYSLMEKAPASAYDFDAGERDFISEFRRCHPKDRVRPSYNCTIRSCKDHYYKMEHIIDFTREVIMTDCIRRSGFLGSK